ncbi:MAG: DUF4166 domain-containing protein [Luteimonas sp.]
MQTLFQRLLGPSFSTLPSTVQALHAIRGRAVYAGRATISRGRNPVANLFAAIAGLPRTSLDVPTTVEFFADETAETWSRNFGGAQMSSRLTADDGQLAERLGPMQFRFDVAVRDDAIHWRTAGVRLLDILPLPTAWFAHVRCREREHAGRYEFLVEAALPLIGRVIRYEGWLEPA